MEPGGVFPYGMRRKKMNNLRSQFLRASRGRGVRRLAVSIAVFIGAAGLGLSAGLEVVLERGGAKVFSHTVQGQGAKLRMPGPLRVGDQLSIRGAKNLRLGLGPLPVADVHAPGGTFTWVVEKGAESVYPSELFFAEKIELRVKVLQAKDLAVSRNLVCNPFAPLVANAVDFPNVKASSETRGDGVFSARNAIDGYVENKGHGAYPNQSWGPEQEEAPWLAIQFGRRVRVDRVELFLRADFPHDESWMRGVLVADGKEICPVELKHDARKQTIRFPAVECEKLELRELEWRNKGWCALTEMQVWGTDVTR